MLNLPHPAVFLDRDGVIIEHRSEYVLGWKDVVIYPDSVRSLVKLSQTEYKIVIVTNQSPIGRGLMSPHTANEINRRLVSHIEQAGGRVDGVYLCPHLPFDNCNCRKPRPGMLEGASEDLNLNLESSILIGDALSDLKAGWSAGLKTVALVRTGQGAEQLGSEEAETNDPFPVFDNLALALDALVITHSDRD